MTKVIDLTGKRFGRLTVIKPHRTKGGRCGWLCKCDCGRETVATTSDLKDGNTSSCGCLRSEITLARSKTHGKSSTRLYDIWINMRQRCNNKNSPSWERYGGRGIKVYSEWNMSFDKFMKWALTSGYKDELTIDRIDVNGNYEPNNCRWATVKEQANNKTNSRIETYNGISASVATLCEMFGKDHSLVNGRLQKGWSIDDAMDCEIGVWAKKKHHYLTFNGQTKSIQEFAHEYGFKRSIIGERLKRGWSVEEALTIKAGGKRNASKSEHST